MGAMYFDSVRKRYPFSSEDVSFFSDLSHRIAVAIENTRFESDVLTIADNLPSDRRS
jgi:GAF domain-containing protein